MPASLFLIGTVAAAQIRPIGTRGSYPDLQLDAAGNLHLVYARYGKTYYRMLPRGGKAFTPEEDTRVGASRDHQKQPDVAVDARGVVHVLGGGAYNRKTAKGWGTPINAGVGRDHHLAVAASGDVWIVYRARQLGARRMAAGATRFDPPVTLFNGGGTDHVYPDICAGTDGTLHVVFRMRYPSNYDCAYLRYDGRRWGPVEWACRKSRSKVEEGPHVALDRNNVPWVAIPEGALRINHRTGGIWEHPIVTIGTAHSRSEPTIGVDRAGNKFVARWGGEYFVYRASAGRWTKARLPSTDGSPIGFVDVVAGAEGAYMVYEQGKSVNKDYGAGAVDLVVVEVRPDGSVVPPGAMGRRPLKADRTGLSARGGGQVSFTLEAGLAHARAGYVLLASLSGTTPGIVLRGAVRLPLNLDPFSWAVFQWLDDPDLDRFTWWLDPAGRGRALLRVRAGHLTRLVGVKMYFAYVTLPRLDYASNAAAILVEP